MRYFQCRESIRSILETYHYMVELCFLNILKLKNDRKFDELCFSKLMNTS